MTEPQHTVPRPAEEKRFYGYTIVALCFFIMMIAWGVNYTYGIFIKPLQSEFGWSRSVPASAYSLAVFFRGVFHILTGRLNDRFGPRLVVSICMVFLGVGYMMLVLISDAWQLFLFYGIVVALGLSGAYVPLVSTVARLFTRTRGLMTAIVMAGSSVGTIFLPVLLERLIFNYGWRATFGIIGVVSLVLLLPAAQFLKLSPAQALSNPGNRAAKGTPVKVELGGFTFREATRTTQFWLMNGAMFGVGFCMQLILIHTPPHVVDLGFSSIIGATVLTVAGVASLAGRLAVGILCDRVGSRNSVIVTVALLAMALLVVLLAKDLLMIYAFAVLFGLGYGGIYALNSPLVAELFGLRSHGVIFGVSAFAGTIGGAIGPALAGYIFDVSGSYQIAFLTSLAVCVTSLILALLLRPVIFREEKDEARGSS